MSDAQTLAEQATALHQKVQGKKLLAPDVNRIIDAMNQGLSAMKQPPFSQGPVFPVAESVVEGKMRQIVDMLVAALRAPPA